MSTSLKLHTYDHPKKSYQGQYDDLIGIDDNKRLLFENLEMLLDPSIVRAWVGKHHKEELFLVKSLGVGCPLVILSGDVGCGKTALAHCIGTPLAAHLKKDIKVYETPSNIRGSGLVGEISNRITESFTQCKANFGKDKIGILIIDEADDIATKRAQNQAHHEDRAGLNVLIKQLDLIRKEGYQLGVIIITNRVDVLDAAVLRRVALHLKFERPEGDNLKDVLKFVFKGVKLNNADAQKLYESATQYDMLYNFSDLIHRVGRQAIFRSVKLDKPLTIETLLEVIDLTEPSPVV